ncbi:hypothetical protein V1512DRAFT_44695 [Lipomyces arxii]|uniref:uncharacterized protein n=1 Tax=Lipomyces arxii TaxID=56418 RepID=UPI0034D01696
MPNIDYSHLVRRGNNALNTNPPSGTDISLTTHGSNWYWTVFCVMAVFSLVFIALSVKTPRHHRMFYYLGTAASLFMTITYFALASDLGYTGIQTEFSHYQNGGVRQIFYARYIGWFLAWPMLMIAVTKFCGMTWSMSLFLVGLQEVFVVCLLIGSLVRSSYKFGFFAFGVASWLLIFVYMMSSGRRSSVRLGNVLQGPFLIGASTFMFLWMLYPICWGLSEAGNVISPTSEGVFYGVLDILFIGLLMYFAVMARKFKIGETHDVGHEKVIRDDDVENRNIHSMETARGDDDAAHYGSNTAGATTAGVAGAGAGVGAGSALRGPTETSPTQRNTERDFQRDAQQDTRGLSGQNVPDDHGVSGVQTSNRMSAPRTKSSNLGGTGTGAGLAAGTGGAAGVGSTGAGVGSMGSGYGAGAGPTTTTQPGGANEGIGLADKAVTLTPSKGAPELTSGDRLVVTENGRYIGSDGQLYDQPLKL